MAGVTFLMVWGKMILYRVYGKLKPCDAAASNCPCETEFRPPLIISAITEEVYKNSPTVPKTA